MNNFVFSQDPILYSSTIPQINHDPVELKKQLDVVMSQYQQLQQLKTETPHPPSTNQIDHLGELDDILASLDEADLLLLNQNTEFIQLNSFIQQSIQAEIINTVKSKINGDSVKVDKINRLKDIIYSVKKERELEQRKSISELNDYIQNYPDMTFNEYKKIKQMKHEG